MNKLTLKFNAATDIGTRDSNQDVFLADEVVSDAACSGEQYFEDVISTSDKIHVFAVCDGIGSFKNSGFAAGAALDAIKKKAASYNAMLADGQNEDAESVVSLTEWVSAALNDARQSLFNYWRDKDQYGSSTTIALLAVRGDEYVFANIGDSPGYLRKADKLIELSVKHNLAAFKRSIGEIPDESDSCILLFHLGESSIDIEFMTNLKSGTLEPGDTIIMCTDGVDNEFNADDINSMLAEGKPSHVFVKQAAGAQNSDNCTAITIYVDGIAENTADTSEVSADESVEEKNNYK